MKQNLKRVKVARLMWKAMEMEGLHDADSERRLLHVFHTRSAVHALGFTRTGDKLAMGTAEHHTVVWQVMVT